MKVYVLLRTYSFDYNDTPVELGDVFYNEKDAKIEEQRLLAEDVNRKWLSIDIEVREIKGRKE